MWTQAHREDHKQSGPGLPSDLTDAQWAASGAVDPGGEARRPAAQDRYARGDECDLLSFAHGLPVAVSAARPVSAALDGLQHLPPVPARRRLGAHLGRASCGAARGVAPRRQPDRRDHRQPIAESGGKRGAASRDEKDAVGYDAGKKVKGRKVHALVDVEGLPLRVIVHSAGMQDRDGAALVLDKIRQRFPWLELVWADAGYNARQVKDAVARSPGLRLEIVKRTDDVKGFVVHPVDGSSSEPSRGSAATAGSPRTMRTSPKPSQPSYPWRPSNSPSDALLAHRLLSQALS